MNEEEKKAIDDLRKILFLTMQANECGLSNNDFKNEIKTYSTILGLIEKQQQELENLQSINKEHQKLNGELREEIERQGNAREIEEKYIEENFISKNKICEKLKEKQERAKKYYEKRGIFHNCNMCNNTCNWYNICTAYQELLEE